MKTLHYSLIAVAAFAPAAWAQSALSVYGINDASLLLDPPSCTRCNGVVPRITAKLVVEPHPAWERPRYDDANRAYGVSLATNAGPFTFRVAHQNKSAVSIDRTSLLGNTGASRNSILAVNTPFLGGTAYAAFSVNRGTRSSPFWNPDNPYAASLPLASTGNSRDMLLGMAYPIGRTTLLAAMVRKNDRELTHFDMDQAALGASYSLSRRTDVYAAFSHSTLRSGSSVARDALGGKMFNIGLRHGF
jgi:predicted porin